MLDLQGLALGPEDLLRQVGLSCVVTWAVFFVLFRVFPRDVQRSWLFQVLVGLVLVGILLAAAIVTVGIVELSYRTELRIVLALSVLAGASLAGVALRKILRRPVVEIMLVVVPAFVAAAIIVFTLAAEVARGFEDQVKTAILAATAVLMGWMTRFFYLELRSVADRVGAQRDLLVALLAELDVYRRSFQDHDRAAAVKAISKSLMQDEKYWPFIMLDGPPVIFNAQAEHVRLLPERTVDPVVRAYAALADVRQFAEDIRQERFVDLDYMRRAPAYGDYFEARETLRALVWTAIAAIEKELRILGSTVPPRRPRRASEIGRPSQ